MSAVSRWPTRWLVALLAALVGIGASSTAIAAARVVEVETYDYDVKSVERVGSRAVTNVAASLSQVGDLREQPAPWSGAAQGASTTPSITSVATEAGSASASTVDDALSALGAGRSGGVRTVGSAGELDDLFAQLSRGGEVVENSYPGKLVRLPDGTTVGLRGASKSGGPTIDIVKPGRAPTKVHVGP